MEYREPCPALTVQGYLFPYRKAMAACAVCRGYLQLTQYIPIFSLRAYTQDNFLRRSANAL